MSETPETQKAILDSNGQWSFVLKECCEKLERERDEARELLESEKITRNHIIQRGIEMQKKLREWKTLCLWGGTPEHIHGFIGGQQTRIWHLECERDEARDKAERYRLESNAIMMQRDEARKHLEDVKEYGTEEINAAVELRQKLATALVERDEAREKIKRQANRICYLEGATNHACGTPLSVALRERDEAREEVKLLKAILDLIKKDVS